MINPVAFEIGPFAIRWYALCIVAGLILAVYLAMKEAPIPQMVASPHWLLSQAHTPNV